MSYVVLSWLWMSVSAPLAFRAIMPDTRARPIVWIYVAMWPIVLFIALLAPLWSRMLDDQ